MSVIKRGFLYITRKRVRSILLLVIMFVAAVLAMLGLAIKQSADKEADAVRRSLESSFSIIRNDGIPKDKAISMDQTGQILRLPHITGRYLDMVSLMVYADVQLSPGAWANEYQNYQEHPENFSIVPFNSDEVTTGMHVPYMCYCSDSGLHEFFRNGAFTLKEGRHIRADDVNKAVISTDVAHRSNLSVGDTITLENREWYCAIPGAYGDIKKTVGEPIKLEIVGLFDVNFSQELSYNTLQTDNYTLTTVFTMEDEIAANMIFSDLATALQTKNIVWTYRKDNGLDERRDSRLDLNSATFFVDDPEKLEAAITEVKAIQGIDWNYFTIKADDSTYKAAANPLTQLGTISAVLIAIAVVGCVVVLGLTLNMWTKSRKREMGILMSLGVAKRKLVLQQLFESLTFAVVALILAAAVSAALAGPVGSAANRIASPRETGSAYDIKTVDFNIVIDKASADPVNLSYGLTAQNILIAAAAVLGSTALSVGITARNITKMKPKAVLRAM
ncbi:MacB-like core domain-containing protein [Sporobacter termitidis DSM 10068]|uniref:MacB-like core domain-containing protein n=1 Tax=Sporobacter termitidis DSM 10068 TaxID=1123282 RepID=A0A1M5W4F5_9FIRM|nr:FtsX-like permease family protein [Sporobacter termitidis]SHH82328.1 MacB-like core domain-containing protein [Sporobacter termitidis DSM 10068]